MPSVDCLSDVAIAPRDFTCNCLSSEHVTDWSTSLSSELYKVNGWGAPYFSINSIGNISVHPYGNDTLPYQQIDLLKVVNKVTDSKAFGGLALQLPLIVRFPDVLKNRLESLHFAFENAVKSLDYGSHYQGVYPVKCNQDRFVVEDIVKFGKCFKFGLEAGSKPELLLAMSSLCNGSPDGLLICNGFKDSEYITLALIARKLALNTVIVLEQEEEVDMVIELSNKLDVKPVIGLRAKLRTKHSGHFGSTSGEKGKFGLTTMQILRVVRKLEQAEMLDCMQLLHFHIGSQIPSTALLSDGVTEAAQIYCELKRLGANMQVIDIGGGLGIDYDGSKSGDSDVSVAYGLQEYASAVVRAVRDVCDNKTVQHPVICSESGRALVSHHSVLIFEAVTAHCTQRLELPSFSNQFFMDGLCADAGEDYNNLYAAVVCGDYDKCVVYCEQMKQHCVEQFKDGSLGIEQLAAVDGFCEMVLEAVGAPEPVRTYNVNLSVFTSVPDFWGIHQLFPILPIHRLDKRPAVKGILSDLTCDSDGKIDKFIGGRSSLPLHETERDGKYYLGMFLGGAYEEALGGLHNLFGGPSVVRVSQSDGGGAESFAVTRAMPGPSCSDVLRVMHYEPEIMFGTLKQKAKECRQSADGVIEYSFNKMPYLVSSDSLRYSDESISNGDCFSDEDRYTTEYISGDDDRNWP